MSKPTVAIVGASTDPEKYGHKSVRAHRQQGFQVYPINPNADEVDGLRAYTSLTEVPVERLSRISMYVPPQVGVQLLDEVAEKAPGEFFLNPGSESDELIEQAKAKGLEPILACSIVDLGVSPADF